MTLDTSSRSANVASREPKSRFRAWLWISSGLLLLISFMVMATYFQLLPGLGGLISTLWSIVIGLSIVLIIRGRQMMAVKAASLIEEDSRPPIIYLRSFSEDEKFAPQRGLALLRSKRAIRLQGLTPASYEEQVSFALKRFGPLIAIGNPKKGLPELGATRIYVNDDAWQQRVQELIATAGLIFMQAGKSDGFIWELQQVLMRAKPHQLILGLPFVGKGGEKTRQAHYDDFRSRSRSILPKDLPERLGEAQFVYFKEGWSPHLFIPNKSAPLPDYSERINSKPTLQIEALKALRSEFLLVSTPYWFRWMIIMTILALPALLLVLVVFIDHWLNG